jgi:hypothetical protein
MVDGVTGSGQGRWQRVKGLDRGQERRRRGSREDLTMVRRAEEVDDVMSSREIFDGKVWQPDGVIESL